MNDTIGPDHTDISPDMASVVSRLMTHFSILEELEHLPEGPALVYQIPETGQVGAVPLPNEGEHLRIGRTPLSAEVPEGCQLAFPGAQQMGRFHFRITCQPEGFVLEDLKSKNGVFVNGETARVAVRILVPSDVIYAGGIIFTYADGGGAQ